jgi:predicted dehydrogenase
MADVIFIGTGVVSRACADVLSSAGFSLHHSFDLEDDGQRGPVILGEAPGVFGIAHQLVDSGRHVLITNPLAMPAERLALLLEKRRRAQALFLWSDRRFHPGYRFVRGLIEADATWNPRFIRHATLTNEPATAGLIHWRALESIALLAGLTSAEPQSVSAKATANPVRSASDFLALAIGFRDVEAFISVGLGEITERRETLVAADDRKAFVDELDRTVPVRLVDAEPGMPQNNPARWMSYAPPSDEELARQQCLAFLEATVNAAPAQAEASLWLKGLGVLQAMTRSLQEGGATIPVSIQEPEPRFRILFPTTISPSPAA